MEFSTSFNLPRPQPEMQIHSATPALQSQPQHPPRLHASEGSSDKSKLSDKMPGDHLPSATNEDSDMEKAKLDADADPNIVDFDGVDDPERAVNWPARRKWSTVAIISAMTLITPLASSMFAPGVPEMLKEFNTSNYLLGSFVVSVYILGYAFGPIFIAPLSEMYGRLYVYHVSNVLFIIFTVACALSTNLNMLIGFRFLAGTAGSTVITIGGGTNADMFVQEQRGSAMAIWSMGPLIGPVIGPIAGGFLAQDVGWRWVFWVIAIAAGVISVAFVVFLRETYDSAILQARTKRLRKSTGNPNLRSKLDSGRSKMDVFELAIIRPMKLLFRSPIVFILSVIMAVQYGYLYLVFTTISEVFERVYGFSGAVVGLTFVGIGIGMFGGLILFGTLSDRSLKKIKAAGQQMKPEHRLPLLLPGFLAMPIGLFIYGWTAQYHVFWIVPILGTALIGLGLIISFMPINTYLIDAFTIYASSAIAAGTIFRSVVGALLPLAGPSMYAKLGLGWGNSLLAFIALAMVPIPLLLLKYGEHIRTNPKYQVRL